MVESYGVAVGEWTVALRSKQVLQKSLPAAPVPGVTGKDGSTVGGTVVAMGGGSGVICVGGRLTGRLTGRGVMVGASVATSITTVAVLVGLAVAVLVGLAVAVLVGLAVAVSVGIWVLVVVAVTVAVTVAVSI